MALVHGSPPLEARNWERTRVGCGRLTLVMGLAAWLFGCAAACADEPLFAPESAEGQALAFLKSVPREWSGFSEYDCHTYDDKNLERMKPAFILASAAFLKAFMQTHGEVTINSAHRTADEQYCVCIGEKGPCAGKGLPPSKPTKGGKPPVTQALSRHQLGIAMDVRAGAGTEREFICMHEFARANPQFGVYFPLGRLDYPHMELVGSRGPVAKLAQVNAGSVKITPCQKLKVMLTQEPLD